MLETPGAFGKSRRGDKEAESELPPPTCDSDLKHVSPYYQQEVWISGHSEIRSACGAHLGCDCSGLQGVVGRQGTVTRRLEVSFHHCTRLRPRRRLSLVSAGSLSLILLRIYKARPRASRMRLLGTPGGFRKGRRSDKEA